MTEPVAVVGGGYVGLVTAVGFAQLGHDVHCIEIDPDRLALLLAGRASFFEPGLDKAISEHADRLHFAGNYDAAVRDCRLFLVAVGTPTSSTGQADLRAVWAVVDGIPLCEGQAVVMKSTTPPGTGRACRSRLDERGLSAVPYVSCPEFLRESTGLWDFMHPDRIVIGDEGTWAGDAVATLYAPLTTPDRIVRSDVTTAETLKLAANAFLAAKISYINEIANLCDSVGADIEQVAHAIGLDPRIGPHCLRAGMGFGGSCFTKDLKSLSHECTRFGVTPAITDAVLSTNDRQWSRVLDKLHDHLGDIERRPVAVLGLSFKPNTSNVRYANSLPLLAGMVASGIEVRAYDPMVTSAILARDSGLPSEVIDQVHFASSALAAVKGADATVLVTEWDELVALDWVAIRQAMAGDLLIDGRNALDPADPTRAGLTYEGIGRRGQRVEIDDAAFAAAPPIPELSVVVLAWDNLPYTRACVESIRRHTDVSYELIIVDNGSAPEAADYARAAADVAVLNDTNRGFAAGMNQGLAAASGRYVAFCNNDTVMPAAWASRLVQTADAHHRAGIVVPAVTAAGTPTTVRTDPGDNIEIIPPFSGPPPAVIYVMPRLVATGVGGWGEEYLVASGEDVDIGFKVWVNDLDIVYDQRVLVDHVGKVSASKLDDWQTRWAANRLIFLEKWAGGANVPRLPSCDEQSFARNRVVAASVAEWMTKYFRARDKAAASDEALLKARRDAAERAQH